MSASIKVYKDVDCTTELYTSGSIYDLFVGPEIGIDGDNGDVANAIIYIKNVGNQAAIGVYVSFNANPGSRLSIRLAGTEYSINNITIGDMAVGASLPVYLRLTVPTGTLMNSTRPNISFKGTSLA